ncbi:MAG: prenyltransferase/squalene oxidase repeat-containing protein [Planctomycetota bacterium]
MRLSIGILALTPLRVTGQDSEGSSTLSPQQQHQKVVKLGIEYLLQKGQNREDGSFSKQISPAVTAMCTTSLLKSGVSASHPQIKKSLKLLESFVQPDGGVYAPNSNLRNYETSVAVMCFVAANKNGRYDKVIQEAIGFQKNIQWDEGNGHDKMSTFYGGQGYGKHKRPDMSNTSFFVDALKAAAEDKDSEAMQKALNFISRTQNLQSEHNLTEYASKATKEDQGGFIYTPAGNGESKAGSTPDGGLRSYASMTYAGLKSFLYAGVSKDDIRVKAAMDWIRRHYDLESNPGMGKQGLFYYYHVFAKALDARGEDWIEDKDGQKHNWREELIEQLAKTQNRDGSWTNEADRWYEGDPNLVTSYSLLALSYCKPEKVKKSALSEQN